MQILIFDNSNTGVRIKFPANCAMPPYPMYLFSLCHLCCRMPCLAMTMVLMGILLLQISQCTPGEEMIQKTAVAFHSGTMCVKL
jgi:hypothetical protein